MNATRRKQLEKVLTELASLRKRLDAIWEAEGEARDNLPDNLLESEQADKMDQAVSDIQSAVEFIEEAENAITEAQGNVQ